MSLVLNKTLVPAPVGPDGPEPDQTEARLNIHVVFTSVDATLAALRKAADLAGRLAARVILLVPQVVPYPLPLESPPMLLDWNERRFRILAEESAVETRVQLYLCRDRLQALVAVLKPHSLVILGGPRRWWSTSEKRLARQLHRAGHEVIFTETE